MLANKAIANRASVRGAVSRRACVVVRAGSIIETAQAKGYTNFVTAVDACGLTEMLSNPTANLTVFVPTNEAFAAFVPKDPHYQTDIPTSDTLLFHMVKGKVQGRHLGNAPNIPNMANKKYGGASGPLIQVNIRAKKGSLLLGSPAQGTQGLAGTPMGGFIIEQDIIADNGIFHVVDGVFTPQMTLPANNGSGSAGASAAW